jgi:protein-S-isoprenylcysteine O-methyltransferase Ste14
MLGLLAIMGLHAGCFGWSQVTWIVRLAALLGFFPALGVPLLASRASAYLAATERIHDERGHTVVSAGPHAVVRHPMYVV